MKRLLILKRPYLELTPVKGKPPLKAEEEKQQLAYVKRIIQSFHSQFNEQDNSETKCNVVKEYLSDAHLLIEFPDKQKDAVYDLMRKIEVVETIDAHIPKEDE